MAKNRAVYCLRVIAGLVNDPLAEEDPRLVAEAWLKAHGFIDSAQLELVFEDME